MSSIFLLVCVCIAFYLYRRYQKILNSVSHIPGPRAIPFLGNALMFIGKKPSDIVTMGSNIVKKYGFFIRILLGPKILILMAEPEDIETFLLHGKTTHKSEEYDYTKDWIGDGLITVPTSQKWFARRKVITPAFHFNILQSFVSVFERNAEIFASKLSTNSSVDVFPLILLCALDNICEASMGSKINALSNADSSYVKAVSSITSIITKRHFMLPLRNDFIFKLTGFQAEQEKLLKILHGFTDSVIISRRNELTEKFKNEVKDESDNRKSNLMDILLQSSIDGQPLSNRDIREEVDTFMFAGHDTSASAIAFCFYNIAKHPEVQMKIVDEISSCIDSKNPMTLKELNDLSYLDLVIKETMRLFPSVPFIGRKVKEDTAINGKNLPKGANVVISPYIMGRNSRIWKNPEEFKPERFELDNLSNLNPFANIPFSAGPRNCIGQKFALLEIKCTIVKLLQRFQISVDEDIVFGILPEIVLKPSNGVHLKLKIRS